MWENKTNNKKKVSENPSKRLQPEDNPGEGGERAICSEK